MKSVQLLAPRRLELRELPEPEAPGPGQVLVRLRAVGVCGSDLHWYRDGRIGPVMAVYPQILGHEGAGEIVAAGPGVTGVAAGQKVAIEPAISCGRCELCLAGRHNNCLRSIFMGTPQRPGLFQEYVTIPASNVHAVPDGMDFVQAALIEPAAVALHAAGLARIRLGDTVAVLGAGPIGMLAAAVARLAGASKIFIADKVAHRLPLARAMGADVAVNTATESFVEAVMDRTRGRGVDVALDAAGAVETINAGLAVARPAGRFVLIGLPSEPELNIDLHAALAKELEIITVRRSNRNTEEAAALLAAGRIPAAMITHRLPLERTPQAFEILDDYSDAAGKVIILRILVP